MANVSENIETDATQLGLGADDVPETTYAAILAAADVFDGIPEDLGSADAYAWWINDLAARQQDSYWDIQAYVPWLWAVDALLVSATAGVTEALLEDLDEAVVVNGGDTFLLAPTGSVSRTPDFLARLWGVKSTVGSTFLGWSLRRIARWYAALAVAMRGGTTNPDEQARLNQFASFAMRAGIQRDPSGYVVSPSAQTEFLQALASQAVKLDLDDMAVFARDQKTVIEAGDPLSNASIAQDLPKAGVNALKGLPEAGWSLTQMLIAGAVVAAIGVVVVQEVGQTTRAQRG